MIQMSMQSCFSCCNNRNICKDVQGRGKDFHNQKMIFMNGDILASDVVVGLLQIRSNLHGGRYWLLKIIWECIIFIPAIPEMYSFWFFFRLIFMLRYFIFILNSKEQIVLIRYSEPGAAVMYSWWDISSVTSESNRNGYWVYLSIFKIYWDLSMFEIYWDIPSVTSESNRNSWLNIFSLRELLSHILIYIYFDIFYMSHNRATGTAASIYSGCENFNLLFYIYISIY